MWARYPYIVQLPAETQETPRDRVVDALVLAMEGKLCVCIGITISSVSLALSFWALLESLRSG